MSVISPYTCPVCHMELFLEASALKCEKGHCFDFHKSGYVNLLLSSKMKSKHPGDNKQMVDMRNTFLSKEYYSALKVELCKLTVEALKTSETERGQAKPIVLDAGCGEGYYTAAIYNSLEQAGIEAVTMGVDISKEALRLAAKRCKGIHFAAASVFDIPRRDSSVDLLTLLFAPFAEAEINRVLKKNGFFIMVIPAARHLFELKQAVYEKPYENEVKDTALTGFCLIKQVSVRERIILDNPTDIQSLFFMTPYAYKTSKEDTARMLSLASLETGIEFEILVYKKV